MKIEIELDELKYYEIVTDGYFDLKGNLLIIPTESLAEVVAYCVREGDLHDIQEGIEFELMDKDVIWGDELVRIDDKQYVTSNGLAYEIIL